MCECARVSCIIHPLRSSDRVVSGSDRQTASPGMSVLDASACRGPKRWQSYFVFCTSNRQLPITPTPIPSPTVDKLTVVTSPLTHIPFACAPKLATPRATRSNLKTAVNHPAALIRRILWEGLELKPLGRQNTTTMQAKKHDQPLGNTSRFPFTCCVLLLAMSY